MPASLRLLPRSTLVLLLTAVLVPVLGYFALDLIPRPNQPEAPEVKHSASSFEASSLPFEQGMIGAPPIRPPRIANVKIVDLDQDGLADVLVSDTGENRVFWYRQYPRGQWTEQPLGEPMPAPANTTVVDIDGDKDLDVLVSVLGYVWPTDERIGGVILLENDGKQKMTPRVLLEDVRRVTDVQPGDVDKDGDVDLLVAVFGFDHGEILWLENRGKEQFRDHQLLAVPGCLHVPIADYDGDGDLDVVTFASQEEEQLFGFENLAQKNGFQPKLRVLYDTLNFDLGSAGLVKTDLDQDGDPDLLLVAGDNLDGLYHYPQAWHGCIWFENRGGWQFVPKRLVNFGGAYGVAPGDVDGDGDQDVVLVSMFNDWHRPGAASAVWLENDGKQNFRPWQIADTPIYLATVDCGDLNGDGRDDLLAGSLRLDRLSDRMGRLITWTSRSKKK